jgi:hypothetical protein
MFDDALPAWGLGVCISPILVSLGVVGRLSVAAIWGVVAVSGSGLLDFELLLRRLGVRIAKLDELGIDAS